MGICCRFVGGVWQPAVGVGDSRCCVSLRIFGVHLDQCHAILLHASVICSVSGSNFGQTDHSVMKLSSCVMKKPATKHSSTNKASSLVKRPAVQKVTSMKSSHAAKKPAGTPADGMLYRVPGERLQAISRTSPERLISSSSDESFNASLRHFEEQVNSFACEELHTRWGR